ncbi:MAG: phosphodiester glycosidase family protein, partial [Muribaculaceae bacterium]|nr:phosphodiester glycosidase family protein [Muribaculaceae bacterium]
MTLKSSITFFALTIIGTISCKGEWLIGTSVYQADTLYHAAAGPGITQTSVSLSGPTKQRIFYAEIDLTNPYVTIKTPKGLNTLEGSMTLSDYCQTLTTGNERYIIGSNADFGVYTAAGLKPCGPSVSNNVPYYAFNQGWYGLGFNENKVPMIDKYIFEGKATSTNGVETSINGLNTPPLSNQTTIITSAYNSSITLDPGITTCKLQKISGELAYIGTSKWRVTEISTATTQPLASDYILLCGNGTGASNLSKLSEGDEVTLSLNPQLSDFGKMTEMTGGCPAILKDGKLLDTSNVLDHLTADNPRTAAGYNADRTKFVMMVVDGRSGQARGMTSTMLAQLMSAVGCTDAINLDGGGSSELYSIDRGILNSPSDGSQRKVTNSLWAVSTAPVDPIVASVATEAWKIVIPQYAAYTPVVYAYNQYGLLLDLDYKGYTLSTADDWGTTTD